MAHIKQNPASLHSQVLWSGLHLQLYCLVFSLLWFQVHLAAWLLDAIQWTNMSGFSYDAQYWHWGHLKQQLYRAALQLPLKKFSAFSPSKVCDCSTSLACRCYAFLYITSKTISSDICQSEFSVSKEKKTPKLKESIMCLLLTIRRNSKNFVRRHQLTTPFLSYIRCSFEVHLSFSPFLSREHPGVSSALRW